jgi:hypothetical protein
MQTKYMHRVISSAVAAPAIHNISTSLNTTFHENRTSGDRVVMCGRAVGGRTDTTRLIVVFRNFANAPKEAHKGNIWLNPTHNKPYFRVPQ